MELVVVIVLSGIVAAMVGKFIARPMEGYAALGRRAELVDVAEMALRRMQRDIRRALPNSIRVDAGGPALEMVNTVDGAAYRDDPPGPGAVADELLDFSGADTDFNVLGRFRNLPLPVGPTTAYRLVIYNLCAADGSCPTPDGISVYATLSSPGPFPPPGSHVVTPAATTVTLTPAPSPPPPSPPFSGEVQVRLNPGHQFALQSPEQRLYVIDTPVSYLCDTAAGTLSRYWSYPLDDAQITTDTDFATAGASTALVANQVSGCRFTYSPGTSQRAAQVTIEFTVERGGEQVRLLHQVHVDNTP